MIKYSVCELLFKSQIFYKRRMIEGIREIVKSFIDDASLLDKYLVKGSFVFDHGIAKWVLGKERIKMKMMHMQRYYV